MTRGSGNEPEMNSPVVGGTRPAEVRVRDTDFVDVRRPGEINTKRRRRDGSSALFSSDFF